MLRFKSLLNLLPILLLAACNGLERPYEGTYEKVLIYVGMGYNNLSSNLLKNFEDMQEGVLPTVSANAAIVAFCHNTRGGGDYTSANPPQLIRILRGPDGRPVADTLETYTDMSLSSSKESLRTALEDIRTRFPSRSYGMLFSSHGTGWIPGGYVSGSEASSIRFRATDNPPWPPTKAIGNQYQGGSSNVRWLEFSDFVDAIPMQLDYLILDACLMGTIEVAWELKDLCRYLVVSPAEILTDGMIYKTLSWDMLSGSGADLQTYCEEYFDYYNAQSGSRRAGTVTLVDCSKLESVAQAFAPIVETHREEMTSSLSRAQRYYYSSSPLRFFYDLRDFAACLGASEAELARLDAALDAAIPYHAETPAFFDLQLERCSGLSVYIPDPRRTKLNNAYRPLGWNRAVRLVE